MKEYSEENMITSKGENQDLINAFLTSLRQAGKSEGVVRDYHSRLHNFFKSRNEHLASIKMDDIQKWITEHQQEWEERTIGDYLRCLRSFFNFCVGEGYIEKTPIPNTDKANRTDMFWELKQQFQNSENHKVISAYLLSLKEAGKKKQMITHNRTVLQLFFRNREMPFSSITWEDIQKWVSDHDGNWSKGTIENYMSFLRSFYGFCEQEGYMEKPPLKKTKWVMSAEKYWETQQPFANKQNQDMVNQFLLHLKNKNRSKHTIVDSRVALQVFFRDRKENYAAVTPEIIQSWTDKYQVNRKRHTVVNQLSFLRSFYRFCVKQGYVEKSPVLYQWVRNVEEKYWILKADLPNAENHDVINEFLLSMKLVNKSKGTIVKYRAFLERFFNDRKESFSSLVPDIVQKWLIGQRNKWNEGTTVSYLGMLSTFFKFCVEEGYMEKSPIKGYWYPLLPKPVPKYLGKEDITKLLLQSEIEKLRDRVIIEFLLVTGCRIGELYGLDRVNVDIENRVAHVCGKGRKIRTVHFTEKCAWLLQRYLESREDNEPALFVSEWETRIGRRQLYTIINEIGTRAELSVNLHPHRLRHTFATELLTKGADISFIADALGHNDISTTQIYAQLPEGELITMYRKYMG